MDPYIVILASVAMLFMCIQHYNSVSAINEHVGRICSLADRILESDRYAAPNHELSIVDAVELAEDEAEAEQRRLHDAIASGKAGRNWY